MTERVLVTGARLPAALEIVRALRADGAEVWAADSLRLTPAGASRCAAGYVRFPSPALSPREFRDSVLAEVRRLGITTIVPVSEEVFALARLRESLPPTTRLFAPGFAELRALHSKWRVLELAADCGVRIPRTMRATSVEELREFGARFPDWILKPEFSRGGYAARVGLPTRAGEIPARLPWLVQECMTGREVSAFAIVDDGRVLSSCVYLPRYRLGRGASMYFDPCESTGASAFIERFAARHNLTGQLGFDFIESGDGELALLECNPRTTSGVHLLNDGWARAFRGERIASASTRACCSRLAVLAFHGPRALLAGRWSGLRADLARARDSCARRSDAAPAWVLPFTSLEIAVRSLAWPVAIRHAYTFDLEWNGEDS